jgi:hypothetical protein
MIGAVALARFGLTRAMAGARFANFASNVGPLMIYALTGHIFAAAGFAMGAGAFLGARTAIRAGAGLVRRLNVVVSCAMALKLMAAPGGLIATSWKFASGG